MVEIYIEPELENLVTESTDIEKWKGLVEKLTLNGQKKLHENDKNPIPFRRMTLAEINTYKVLCPQSADLERYDGDTIPLRVLETAGLCRAENYFKTLEIWHNNTKVDPVLVGYVSSSWSGEPYLIARWGDELRAFVELQKIAYKQLVLQQRSGLRKAIAICSAQLDTVTDLARLHINGTTQDFLSVR